MPVRKPVDRLCFASNSMVGKLVSDFFNVSKVLAVFMLLSIFACSDAVKENNTNSKDERGMHLSDNMAKAKAFLEENAKKEGVTVTASGLQYEVINSGEGKTPGPTDTVVTHYAGSFLDGSEFDSSISRGEPTTFPVNGVISGWTEALQLMQEGDKWRLFIPPNLAYGERGVGPIPGNTALIFEIELITVK
ncbi:MAG: FKBP-type peptidyl-prolyl cis-trans isomerase FklB [Candidatus Azotimanducaceae bacterium]|jgi:FKBP-type peptidyl-prolyl cis-trans isomerase FklB